MGKGGTRFVSDAIAVRGPRQRASFSARELRRDMETYCETGVHPDIEKACQEHEDQPAETPLPQFDPERPFVYFQMSISKKPVGIMTVELFREQNPRGVEILQNRCKAGSQMSLERTRVHKLATDCAFFIGKPRRTREVVQRPRLHHTDKGAVSVSVDGNEIAVAMTEDALALDETHEVVGRVHIGLEILDQINEIVVGPTEAPLDEILITRCGLTDHTGWVNDARSASGRGRKSAEQDLIQQHRQQRQRTQNDLESALQEGLKRKAEAPAERRSVKKSFLEPVMSTSSSSEEDE